MRKMFHLILSLHLILLTSCSAEESQVNMQIVPNHGVYHGFHNALDPDFLIVNIALNHSSNIKKDDLRAVELLPRSNIVSIEGFSSTENPPQAKFNQTAIMIKLKTLKTGRHTFKNIRLKTKFGEQNLNLGHLDINVREGNFSGLLMLTQVSGVFSRTTPLYVQVQNDNDYPVILTDVVVDHPLVKFDPKDVKLNGESWSTHGYKLRPGQSADIEIAWKVKLPVQKVLNIETRPLLVAENVGKQEYAAIANMVYRNDFE